MDASRGRRGHRPTQGRRRGRRADVIQDPLIIINPLHALIDIHQVGVDAPPTQDPPIIDPPAQDPPVGDSLPRTPRLFQRAGGLHLETPKTIISKRLLVAGDGFFGG
ncbi:hypothetical protein GQ457_18G006890 [Hibiscus cannabinus]